MPKIKPLRSDLEKYLTRRNLKRKFSKQQKLFEQDISHPSLHSEILEPKKLKI